MYYLSKNVNSIFIMLGSGCNFQCRYCMQDLTGKPHKNVLPTEINEDIFDFIENLANTQNCSLTLHFYGGEPFLYFDKIKYIVSKTEHIKNIDYSTVSNGSLITKEIADYLNKHNFSVGISYDGYGTLATRKHDVFKTNKANLLSLNNLGLTGVVSAYSSPKDILEASTIIDNEYYSIHKKHIYVSHDEIYDTGLFDTTLLKVDYQKVFKEVERYADLWLKITKNELDISEEEFHKKYYIIYQYINNFVQSCSHRLKERLSNKLVPKYTTRCSNGLHVYNMDLEGNLYECHNVYSSKCGDIYSDFYEYFLKILEGDNTKENYEKRCHDCLAYPICYGGCKLISDKAYEETYCNLKKAVYLPVINMLLKENANGG